MLAPQVILSQLSKGNATGSCCDFGPHQLIATAIRSTVLIYDDHCQVVQTLDDHSSDVSCVRWCPEVMHSNLDREFTLRLASGDEKGNVLLWSVISAHPDLLLVDSPTGRVLDLAWPHRKTLLTLRVGGIVTLWDCERASVLWRKVMFKSERVLGLRLDPFASSCSSSSSSLFSHQRALLFTATGNMHWVLMDQAGHTVKAYGVSGGSFTDCCYALWESDLLLFVLPHQLILYDVKTEQQIGGFSCSATPLQRVVSFVDDPLSLLALHTDGSLSHWRRPHDSFNYQRVSIVHIPGGKANTLAALCARSRDTIASVSFSGCVRFWEMPAANDEDDDIDSSSIEIVAQQPVLSGAPCSIAVNPEANHQVAVGTFAGSLLLIDLRTAIVEREIIIKSGQAIRDVEWIDGNRVIFYICEEVHADLAWCNTLAILSWNSGNLEYLISPKRPDSTYLHALRVSPARRTALLLRKNRPLELWDLSGMKLLGAVRPFIQVTAAAWQITENPEEPERFVSSAMDQTSRLYVLENSKCRILASHPILGTAVVYGMAWRENTLVLGDSNGSVTIWDASSGEKTGHMMNYTSGLIRSIDFCPTSEDLISILFNNGGVSLYSLKHGSLISSSESLKSRNISSKSVKWVGGFHLLVSTSDGGLRLLDKSFGGTNSTIRNLSSMSSPYLLPVRDALHVKAKLLQPSLEPDQSFADRVPIIRPDVLAKIELEDFIERAIAVAKFYGDTSGVTIWKQFQRTAAEEPDETAGTAGTEEELRAKESQQQEEEEQEAKWDANSVSTIFPSAEASALSVRAQAFDKNRPRGTTSSLKSVAQHILLGNQDSAVTALLETGEYAQHLLACVVAATQSPTSFARTAKMAATGLIAQGGVHVDEGVQLLIIVGQVQEACRYLQSSDRWEEAARLCNLRLRGAEAVSVNRRYAEFLLRTEQWNRASTEFMKLREFPRSVYCLYSAKRYEESVLLLQQLQQRGLVTEEDMTSFVDLQATVTLASVQSSSFLEYGFLLHRCGHTKGAQESWSKAGPAGQAMIETVAGLPSEAIDPPGRSNPTESTAGSKVVTGRRRAPSLRDSLNAFKNKFI